MTTKSHTTLTIAAGIFGALAPFFVLWCGVEEVTRGPDLCFAALFACILAPVAAIIAYTSPPIV